MIFTAFSLGDLAPHSTCYDLEYTRRTGGGETWEWGQYFLPPVQYCSSQHWRWGDLGMSTGGYWP